MKVIVTAGHTKSIHTICLIHQLLANGHEVLGVVIVNTFQISRLRNYLRQYGIKTVVEKFKSHFLHKENSKLSKETKYINEYRSHLQIKEKNLIKFSKRKNINVIQVPNLNNEKAIIKAKLLNPDIIIYSGGGILRKELINTSRYSVLNAHSGPLPEVRGMNCIEWSLMLGIAPTTSIHLIDVGIDTGSILYKEIIPFKKNDDLYDIRGKATVHNVELLIKVLNSFEDFYQNKTIQKKSEGKQYFTMHDNLKEIINQKLLNEYR